MPAILITGADGQLGRAIQLQAPQSTDWTFYLTDRPNLDICDPAAVNAFFEAHRIDFCINAAGYTAVDRAEAEPELAAAVNRLGTQHLAGACQQHKATLLHLSTDYVYHTPQNTPFEETDPVMPQSVYAQTKWEGEQAALRHCSRTFVVRTSWVYSPFGNNFLLTMLRLGRERDQVRVVYDQVGTPTSAFDLADALLHMIQRIHSGEVSAEAAAGIYNFSPEGVASWYDFALAIFEKTGNPIEVVPIRTIQYPTPALRPPFSLMSKEKIKSTFQLSIPHWRDGLDRCLARLEQP